MQEVALASHTAESRLENNRIPEANKLTKLKIMDSNSMFVDKFKPTKTSEIIGDHSNCMKLKKWLQEWHTNRESESSSQGKAKKRPTGFGSANDGSSFKAVLLSGPPGIGKTTTAQLACLETKYAFKELNASDTRSKKSLTEEVSTLLNNRVLDGYFKMKNCSSDSINAQHALIMDEVDGMAGNEDRGGVAELILLIKKTKVPIICICNDRSHPKVRSLVNYCYDLRFYKPQISAIKNALQNIANKEGIKVETKDLEEIAASSNQDIRQAIHYLNLMSAGSKSKVQRSNLTSQSMKDVKLGPFEAIKKVFPGASDARNMTLNDKCDLFFYDYNLMPLMVYENYLKCSPNPQVKRTDLEKLQAATRAADALAFGDLIETQIRSNNSWSLLPLQSVFSVAMPSHHINGTLNAMPMFPTYLGKVSNYNKRDRLLQELKSHMNLKISGSKTALCLDYLVPLRDAILKPLKDGDIDGTVQVLNSYYLRKEDFDAIIELTSIPGQPDPYSKIDTKTKTALTRAINKSTELLPYSISAPIKKSKGARTTDDGDFGEEGEDMVDDDEEEKEDGVDGDANVKVVKKPKKSNGTKVEPGTSNGNSKAEPAKKPAASKKPPSKKMAAVSLKSPPEKSSPKKSPPKKAAPKKSPVKKTNGRKRVIIESSSEEEDDVVEVTDDESDEEEPVKKSKGKKKEPEKKKEKKEEKTDSQTSGKSSQASKKSNSSGASSSPKKQRGISSYFTKK